jgi:hypothetical protein
MVGSENILCDIESGGLEVLGGLADLCLFDNGLFPGSGTGLMRDEQQHKIFDSKSHMFFET